MKPMMLGAYRFLRNVKKVCVRMCGMCMRVCAYARFKEEVGLVKVIWGDNENIMSI